MKEVPFFYHFHSKIYLYKFEKRDKKIKLSPNFCDNKNFPTKLQESYFVKKIVSRIEQVIWSQKIIHNE